MNRLFRSKPNNLFVLIRRYSTLFDLSWQIMLNYSFQFVLQFESTLFYSFRFVLRYRLYRFDSVTNQMPILIFQVRRLPWSKLGRIIRLEKIIRKYSVFVLLFGTQIRSKQVNLFVSYKKRMPIKKLNNVEYCRIVGILGHFW